MGTNGQNVDFQSLLRDYVKSPSQEVVTSNMSSSISSSAINVVVSVSTSAQNVKASFNPVAAEQTLATKSLNQIIRKGFAIPKSSTR